MPFKALNNREKEECSYIYSHTTKHLNFAVKSKSYGRHHAVWRIGTDTDPINSKTCSITTKS